jgi:hypothetical protein
MEYKWYDASQSVNEPHYANHRILEYKKKMREQPLLSGKWRDPPHHIPTYLKAL